MGLGGMLSRTRICTNFHECLCDGYLEPRKARNTRNGVHGWVWVRFFQEHEYARIDTNIRFMGIEGNREITRMCVHGCDVFQENELALIDTNAYVMGVGKYERNRNKN